MTKVRKGFLILLVSSFCIVSLSVLPQAVSEASADMLTKESDRDGDGLGDIVGYDGYQGVVYARKSSTLSIEQLQLGSGSVPLSFDYDKDGAADLLTYNPTNSAWTVNVDGTTYDSFVLGNPGEYPAVGSFSTKSCGDFVTYDRKEAKWRITRCKDNKEYKFSLGSSGDVPVPADFDCDGLLDAATFNRLTNEWTIRKSSNKKTVKFAFGLWGDIPLAADFNGDSCAQAAVYRPSTNQYFVRKRGTGTSEAPVSWGLPGDIPTLVNVDGNKKADFAIFRPWENSYYIKSNPDQFFFHASFGLSANSDGFPSWLAQPVSPHSVRSVASRVPGSYDGDLRSEFVVLRPNSLGQPTWLVLSPSGKGETFKFGYPQSVAACGDYDGDDRTDPVVVSETDEGLLEWRMRSHSGSEYAVSFGLNGDTPLTGDFDCDRKNDFAVTRQQNGLHNWFLKLTTDGDKGPYAFGLEADRVFAGDINGDGCDELVVAQEVFGGIYWYYINYRDLERGKGPQMVPWGLAGDNALTPMDMNGDGRSDFIVVRSIGGGLTFFIRFMGQGFGDAYQFGLDGDIPMTGYYTGVNQGEIAVYRPGQSSAVSSFYIRRFNGVAAQVLHGSGLDSVVRPDGRRPESKAGDVCTVTHDFYDGSGGALWKAHSDNTGRPVFLLPAEYWTNIESIGIYGADGQYLTDASRRTCCPNGNRAHYDVSWSGSKLEAYAPIQVRLNLRNGATECRVVYHPSQRED